MGASLALGFILHTLQLTELGDAYEGWLMLTGAVFVASMTVWMWRTGKRLKQEIESKLSTLAGGPRAPGRWAAWGLFVFVFLMVFREGTETVLFLAAVSLRTTALMNFIGGVLGLALAVGLGVAFFKGSLKVNLRKFFAVTTLVLLVVAVQLFVSGLHELSEALVLPSGPREMRIVGKLVNNDALFFVVVVALCLFLVITQRIQAGGMAADELGRLAAPERRKVLAEQRRDRFWKTAAAVRGPQAPPLPRVRARGRRSSDHRHSRWVRHGPRGPGRLHDLRYSGVLSGRRERHLPQLRCGDQRPHDRLARRMQSDPHQLPSGGRRSGLLRGRADGGGKGLSTAVTSDQ